MRHAVPRTAVFLLTLLLSTLAHAAGQATVSASVDSSDVKPGEKVVVHITMDVAAGFHAQSHTPSSEDYIALTITPTDDPAVTFGEIKYPPGEDHDYPNLGKLNVYTGNVTFDLPVTIKPDAKGDVTVAGKLRYQACDDKACFPPQKPTFFVVLTVAGGPETAPATQATATPMTSAATPSDTPPTSDTAATLAFGLDLAGLPVVGVLGIAFLVGIIFNAVPCVLPVIPLKIAGFYEAAQHSRARCFGLGTAFSTGLVASFVVLAVLVVGLKSLSWGQQFQSPIFTGVIVAVLVAMAASQFGLFDINLPTAAYGFSPRHDTVFGNVLFGVLTAALSTPCTIGPFAGLLAWALKQPAILGGGAVVVVGIGMAAPYLILSAFPQVVRRFPRTGPLGEIIKQTLAFLVLATAFYFARPFLGWVPESAFWWALFAFIPVAGVYLVIRTAQALGTARATTIAAVVALIVTLPSAVLAHRLASQPYEWLPFTDAALADANAAGRPVLIDFTADWCGNCHYLEANVLKDTAVVDAVKSSRIVMLKADVTHGTEAAVPLLEKLSPAGAIPLTVIYRPGRSDPKLLVGIYNIGDLLGALKDARPDA